MSKQQSVIQYETGQVLENELFSPVNLPDPLRSQYQKIADSIAKSYPYTPSSDSLFWNTRLHSNSRAIFQPVYATNEEERKVYDAMKELERFASEEDFEDRLAFKLIGKPYIEDVEQREKFLLEHEDHWMDYADAKATISSVENKIFNPDYDKRKTEEFLFDHRPNEKISLWAKIASIIGVGGVALAGGLFSYQHGKTLAEQLSIDQFISMFTKKYSKDLLPPVSAQTSSTTTTTSAQTTGVSKVEVFNATIPVKFDGKISPGEYNDSKPIDYLASNPLGPITKPLEGHLFVKTDGNWTYFGIDIPSGTQTPKGTAFFMWFDTNNSGSNDKATPDVYNLKLKFTSGSILEDSSNVGTPLKQVFHKENMFP